MSIFGTLPAYFLCGPRRLVRSYILVQTMNVDTTCIHWFKDEVEKFLGFDPL